MAPPSLLPAAGLNRPPADAAPQHGPAEVLQAAAAGLRQARTATAPGTPLHPAILDAVQQGLEACPPAPGMSEPKRRALYALYDELKQLPPQPGVGVLQRSLKVKLGAADEADVYAMAAHDAPIAQLALIHESTPDFHVQIEAMALMQKQQRVSSPPTSSLQKLALQQPGSSKRSSTDTLRAGLSAYKLKISTADQAALSSLEAAPALHAQAYVDAPVSKVLLKQAYAHSEQEMNALLDAYRSRFPKAYSDRVYARARADIAGNANDSRLRKPLGVSLLVAENDQFLVTTTRVLGGFSKIRRALRLRDGRIFVIKEMWHDDLRPEPKSNRMTQSSKADGIDAEARDLRSINSPLAPECVLQYRTPNGTLKTSFVQEAFAGDLLNIEDRAVMPLGVVRQMIAQGARGLQGIHAQGALHNDLKPENMLFNPNAPAERMFVVSDVGLMAAQGDNRFRGTPNYMPSQVGREPRVEQSDVWSLAVSAFEMISRLPSPFAPSDDLGPLEVGDNYARWQMVYKDYTKWFADLPRSENGELDVDEWFERAVPGVQAFRERAAAAYAQNQEFSEPTPFDAFFMPLLQADEAGSTFAYALECMMDPDPRQRHAASRVAAYMTNLESTEDDLEATKTFVKKIGTPRARQAEDLLLSAYYELHRSK